MTFETAHGRHLPLSLDVGTVHAREDDLGRTEIRAISLLGSAALVALGATIALTAIDKSVPASTTLLRGTLIGLLAWLFTSWASRDLVRPERANPRSYRDLESRARKLKGRFGGLPDTPEATDLGEQYRLLKDGLADPAVHDGWSSGLEYVYLWQRLHEIEEGLITYAAKLDLQGILDHDVSRVEGSPLASRDSLKADIEAAQKAIGHGDDDDALRRRLTKIRHEVNAFRDAQLQKLVDARDQLDNAAALLAFVAYGIFALAILTGANPDYVVALGGYALFGMAGNLIPQMASKEKRRTSVDIYGYGGARVFVSFVLAAGAGMIGVPLLWILGNGATDLSMQKLNDALESAPANYLVAAAFGMTPELIIERLTKYVNSTIRGLESSSEASTAAGGTASGG